jgi:oligopeptide transport system permease protein
MRFTDIVYAFPDILLLIIIMATLRNTWLGDIMSGLFLIFIALAIVNWVGYARLVRGQVLSLREKEFVEAARTVGASPVRIMIKHLLPNSLAPIIVNMAFSVPLAIFGEAALSFIGIGIKPPTPSWGVMLNEGWAEFTGTPTMVLFPAACIAIVMLSFTFIGDGLRDALDPRMKI